MRAARCTHPFSKKEHYVILGPGVHMVNGSVKEMGEGPEVACTVIYTNSKHPEGEVVFALESCEDLLEQAGLMPLKTKATGRQQPQPRASRPKASPKKPSASSR
jgi:hypothetical protein